MGGERRNVLKLTFFWKIAEYDGFGRWKEKGHFHWHYLFFGFNIKSIKHYKKRGFSGHSVWQRVFLERASKGVLTICDPKKKLRSVENTTFIAFSAKTQLLQRIGCELQKKENLSITVGYVSACKMVFLNLFLLFCLVLVSVFGGVLFWRMQQRPFSSFFSSDLLCREKQVPLCSFNIKGKNKFLICTISVQYCVVAE